MKRVLIAEDSAVCRGMLRARLVCAPFHAEVVEVETYEAAELELRTKSFDAVIFDVHLGEAKSITLAELAAPACVIFVSATAEDLPNDHLVVPKMAGRWISQIERLLSRVLLG